MVGFADFEPLCRNVPSYPWCNLFYRQLQREAPDVLTGLSANSSSAPVGVDPVCGIPRVNFSNELTNGATSISNVANIAVCGASFIFVAVLIFLCGRRKAAVGRVELRLFLIAYLLTLPLQILTTGALLEQGTLALTVLTAIHAGAVAMTFWGLLANGIVATQVVEDGTLSSVLPYGIVSLMAFGVTLYISLDIGLGVTSLIGGVSDPPEALKNIPLFVLTSIWPGACALVYFILMIYIVVRVLRETKPMWYYILAAVLFVLSQLALFLLNKVICTAADAKIDGSFIASLLETAAVGVIYLAWMSITEESWEDDGYYTYPQ